ncbi:hypothetical protein Tco_1278671, partial [Tanacetum coccineum]
VLQTKAHTPATVDTELEPEEAPSEIDKFLALVSKAPLTDEEFEASDLSDTRTTSSYSSASSDSTAPLSPDHPLTQGSPTPMPTQASFHYAAFHKRYRSSYETPSPSPSLTLLSGSEESEDEDLVSEGEKDAPEGQQQAVQVMDTTVDEPLGLGYGAPSVPDPVEFHAYAIYASNDR